jgi:hypothetical protein
MSSTDKRTVPATALCLFLIVAALGLFMSNFEWPTSRIVREGFSISQYDILVYDVLPIIAAGFAIGLGAIAITTTRCYRVWRSAWITIS